jgi:hypothetical protein
MCCLIDIGCCSIDIITSGPDCLSPGPRDPSNSQAILSSGRATALCVTMARAILTMPAPGSRSRSRTLRPNSDFHPNFGSVTSMVDLKTGPEDPARVTFSVRPGPIACHDRGLNIVNNLPTPHGSVMAHPTVVRLVFQVGRRRVTGGPGKSGASCKRATWQ